MLKNTRKNRLSPGTILLTGFAMRELMDYYNNWRHARRSIEEFFPEEEKVNIARALDSAVERMMKTDSPL
ncbi:MAG: hypothetical protein V4642_01470 [Bacteroidota bacterium]